MIDFDDRLALGLRKKMVEAIAEYRLIEAGDRVMVGVSGGKDSAVLLALLTDCQRRAPFDFDVEGVMLDQKQPGFDASAFKAWVERDVGARLTIIERDTYSVVIEKTPANKIYCVVCSRLRRGILYEHAFQNGFTKLALGHHREDVSETLLLNLFYSGQISSMPPRFVSDDQRNTVIRPLFRMPETEIAALALDWKIPVIPCNLCGSQEGLKRKQIKKLLVSLSATIPDIHNSIAGAVANVKRSHLADAALWDFVENSPAAL